MYLWQGRLGLTLASEPGDDEHRSALPLQHALDHHEQGPTGIHGVQDALPPGGRDDRVSATAGLGPGAANLPEPGIAMPSISQPGCWRGSGVTASS